MLVGYHINKFRLLKVFQILVTIICAVLEITEFIAYSSYVDDVNSSKIYNVRLSKLEYFENTNIFLFVLYLSAGIANLDPWYTGSGNGLNCNFVSENMNITVVAEIVNWKIFQCQLALASLSVCWANIGLLLISLLISWRRAVELSWIITPSSSFNDDIRGTMEEIVDSTSERMFETNHEPANF
ncbi:23536_t:CDS:2 [Dentiscutata erythropus]|uniref:23536_t:CDS:1 n=1 Tax=Dentiscutata erythropus TaxID=1348616 RepID=A0A9N8VDL6_9GLOM|nr:23536_t:CDS:2 [Dentiscutata erythropus]